MKAALSLAFCLAASLWLTTASAQVYQWKDGSGRTVISDRPPPGSAQGSRTVEASVPPDAAKAPKTTAEKDMEFRKRQQEGKEKADKEAKEQLAAAERKENCQRARRQLAALESGERMVTRDDKGERRFLEDAERQQEMERARTFVSESCK